MSNRMDGLIDKFGLSDAEAKKMAEELECLDLSSSMSEAEIKERILDPEFRIERPILKPRIYRPDVEEMQ